jgi:hypothetical protein
LLIATPNVNCVLFGAGSSCSFVLFLTRHPAQDRQTLQMPIRLQRQRLDIQRNHSWPSAAQPSAARAIAAASSSLDRMALSVASVMVVISVIGVVVA